MSAPTDRCAVCGATEAQGAVMSRVYVERRSLILCRSHAATVVAARPVTFEELRALFVGTSIRKGNAIERRSPIPRRAGEDRRAFPPRPEGRRLSAGRRSTDQAE